MRRRHRIALRPQAKRERNRRLLSVLSFAVFAGAFVYAVRRVPKEALEPRALLRRIPAPDFLRVERVTVAGAPEAALPLLDAALAPRRGRPWAPWAGGDVEAELLARFPFLEAASANRDWRARAVTIAVTLQTPIALATRRGRPAGWLGDTGLVFEAPEGAYPPLDLPLVELGDAEGPRFPELSDFVKAAAVELPGRLARVSFRSPEEGCPKGLSGPCGPGWEVTAADGTTLLWGGLDWTREKLSRLKEVLGDAGKRFGPGLTADLRYFEDGKILVRPAGVPARTR